MDHEQRSARLGTMDMNKLIPKVALPIMFSMLVQALYNVVDSIFVARYSAKALGAVSLAFPVQMLLIAVAVGQGIGMNSLISRRLGEKRGKEARDAAHNGILLGVCGWALFAVFGLLFSGTFFTAFTTDQEIQRLGQEYLSVVTVFSFGVFMSITLERMMQSTGNTMYAMLVQCAGAVTNLILDPIMIFGLLGVPAMGVRGAAVATVIGQFVSMFCGLALNQCKNKELMLRWKELRLRAATVRAIYGVGFPSIIMQSIGSVMTALMNLILIAYGDIPVSVLGIYFKLQSFVFMPVFGLTNGMVAIVGYNYGARNQKRVYEAVKVALRYAITIMLVGMLIFLLLPRPLLSLFASDDIQAAAELMRIGVPALRIIALHFWMASINIVLSTVFQAIGQGMKSLFMSIIRQLAVLLPVSYLLSNLGGLGAIWWAFPISEAVALALCMVLFRQVDRKYLQPLGEDC